MQLDENGIDLIKSFEGCELVAYQDVADVWTIGIGHAETHPITELPLKKGDTLTMEQAKKVFKDDIKIYVDAVNKHVTAELNANQFAALVSLCFNVGETMFAFGTKKRVPGKPKSKMVQHLNKNEFELAMKEFATFRLVNGKVNKRIEARRAKEIRYFWKPVAPNPAAQKTVASKQLDEKQVDSVPPASPSAEALSNSSSLNVRQFAAPPSVCYNANNFDLPMKEFAEFRLVNGKPFAPKPTAAKQLDENGRDLIKAKEDYKCEAGKSTIGLGHTGMDITKDTVWTQQQTQDAFKADIKNADQTAAPPSTCYTPVKPLLPSIFPTNDYYDLLNGNQSAAPPSACYNVGLGIFSGSAPVQPVSSCKPVEPVGSLLASIFPKTTAYLDSLEPNQSAAPDNLCCESRGLTIRRGKEMELFETVPKPPVDPALVDPAPANPAPANPAAVNPAPVNPVPVIPVNPNPAPPNPAPVNPAPVNPANPAPVHDHPLTAGPDSLSDIEGRLNRALNTPGSVWNKLKAVYDVEF